MNRAPTLTGTPVGRQVPRTRTAKSVPVAERLNSSHAAMLILLTAALAACGDEKNPNPCNVLDELVEVEPALQGTEKNRLDPNGPPEIQRDQQITGDDLGQYTVEVLPGDPQTLNLKCNDCPTVKIVAEVTRGGRIITTEDGATRTVSGDSRWEVLEPGAPVCDLARGRRIQVRGKPKPGWDNITGFRAAFFREVQGKGGEVTYVEIGGTSTDTTPAN